MRRQQQWDNVKRPRSPRLGDQRRAIGASRCGFGRIATVANPSPSIACNGDDVD
jgi:hypothetical protein